MGSGMRQGVETVCPLGCSICDALDPGCLCMKGRLHVHWIHAEHLLDLEIFLHWILAFVIGSWDLHAFLHSFLHGFALLFPTTCTLPYTHPAPPPALAPPPLTPHTFANFP